MEVSQFNSHQIIVSKMLLYLLNIIIFFANSVVKMCLVVFQGVQGAGRHHPDAPSPAV